MYDKIKHYGIIGMKWGVRRFQNKDGSLTPRGQARIDRKDQKWLQKNAGSITKKAYKKSRPELKQYQKELLNNPENYNKNKKLSAKAINTYNTKAAKVLSSKVTNLQTPSGRVVSFVAKRKDLGVFVAMSDQGYNMNQLKNGVFQSGKIAYKKKNVDTIG